MSFDEDDELPSRSSAEFLSRADHGKKEHLEKKAAAKGQLLQLQRAALKGQVSAKSLNKEEDRDEKEANQAAQVQEEEGKAATFGPKSNADEAKEQVQTAQEKQSSDKLVQDAKRAAAAQNAAGEEYQQDLG